MLAAGIFAASAAEATIDFSQQGWSNEFELTASTPIGDSGISVAFAKGKGTQFQSTTIQAQQSVCIPATQ